LWWGGELIRKMRLNGILKVGFVGIGSGYHINHSCSIGIILIQIKRCCDRTTLASCPLSVQLNRSPNSTNRRAPNRDNPTEVTNPS
jgi:hypothetical protein